MEIAKEIWIGREQLNRANAIEQIRRKYVTRACALTDDALIDDTITRLWSDLEPLLVVDEDDYPMKTPSGDEMIAFRKDIEMSEFPEFEKGKTLFCRASLFILEDASGNIVVSRRSMNKSHPGKLEIAGGHAVLFDSYLTTVFRELKEELSFDAPEWSITENDRIAKYRVSHQGKWKIISAYRVKILDKSLLRPDPNEIQDLAVFTPEELFHAIHAQYAWNAANGDFFDSHAFCYLEYLEIIHWINTEALRDAITNGGLLKNRIRMPLFWGSELHNGELA